MENLCKLNFFLLDFFFLFSAPTTSVKYLWPPFTAAFMTLSCNFTQISQRRKNLFAFSYIVRAQWRRAGDRKVLLSVCIFAPPLLRDERDQLQKRHCSSGEEELEQCRVPCRIKAKGERWDALTREKFGQQKAHQLTSLFEYSTAWLSHKAALHHRSTASLTFGRRCEPPLSAQHKRLTNSSPSFMLLSYEVFT